MSPNVALLGAILLAVGLEVAVAHSELHRKCRNQTTVTVDECCKLPQLVDRSVIESCRDEVPFQPHGQRSQGSDRPHPGACIAKCILEKMNAFKDHKVSTVGFLQSIQPRMKDVPSDLKQFVETTVRQCNADLTVDVAFSVDVQPDATKPACNLLPKNFLNCVYSELFLQCPANIWTDRKECTLLKEKLKGGCPYFALRRHGPHKKHD